MKIKHFAALMALTVLQGALLNASLAQDAQKINKWFGDIDNKYPNLRKNYNVGDIQKPGKLQTSGKIQTTKDIQAPRGLKAIKTTSSPCSQRFLVGADALFEFDQAVLTPTAEETLSVLGPMIENAGAHPVTIEGHTDSIGADDYNQKLSERRAERVRNWFLEHRIIEKKAVSTIGFGEKKPVAPNTKPDGKDNPAGRCLNRRVEIVINTCASIDEPKTVSAPVSNKEGTIDVPPAATETAVPLAAPPGDPSANSSSPSPETITPASKP